MEPDEPGPTGTLRVPDAAGMQDGTGDPAGADAAIEVLYQTSALGLIRLAYVMLGDRPSAEDGSISTYRTRRSHG